MNDRPLLIVIPLILIAFVALMVIGTRATNEQNKRHEKCILACQTTDVMVINGRCGCIVWK